MSKRDDEPLVTEEERKLVGRVLFRVFTEGYLKGKREGAACAPEEHAKLENGATCPRCRHVVTFEEVASPDDGYRCRHGSTRETCRGQTCAQWRVKQKRGERRLTMLAPRDMTEMHALLHALALYVDFYTPPHAPIVMTQEADPDLVKAARDLLARAKDVR